MHVHELGFSECAKSYVFRGTKDYTPAAVAQQLGLGGSAGRGGMPVGGKPGPMGANAPSAAQGAKRFVLPLSDCEFVISGVLDELQRDAFPPLTDHRPARCTGTALQARPTAVAFPCMPAYAHGGLQPPLPCFTECDLSRRWWLG